MRKMWQVKKCILFEVQAYNLTIKRDSNPINDPISVGILPVNALLATDK